jgi:hypothetical protein
VNKIGTALGLFFQFRALTKLLFFEQGEKVPIPIDITRFRDPVLLVTGNERAGLLALNRLA